MDIIRLKQRPALNVNNKLYTKYTQLGKLLDELRKHELSENTVQAINREVEVLNATSDTDRNLKKLVNKKQQKIVKLLESKQKIVTKNHYRNTWLAIGMSAFGIPLGVAFGASLDNMAFLGVGLPIGMAMGIAVGTSMDKKAQAEGRQLDIELK